jgi:hypothetical protein
MKSEGINNTLFFILKETSPILELGDNNVVEESDKKLLKGTIVQGQLKTRVVNMNGQKIAKKNQVKPNHIKTLKREKI